MAKGIIKTTTGGSQAGQTSVSITVTPPGGVSVSGGFPQPSSNPPAQPMVGTLQDTQTNQIVNFNQAYGAELGLVVGAKVNYTTVNANINGQVQTVANSVRLLQRGEILTINSDDTSGTLMDKATQTPMQFFQEFAQESGLVAQTQGAKGTMVHFETIISPITALPIAVALEVI